MEILSLKVIQFGLSTINNNVFENLGRDATLISTH